MSKYNEFRRKLYLLLICLYILISDLFSTNIVCLGFLPIVPPLIIFLLEYKELVDKYDLTSVKVSATFDYVQLELPSLAYKL